MKRLSVFVGILTGALVPGGQLLAQTTTTTPTFLTNVSTGMLGLAVSQTAQLDVVNLSTAPTTTTNPVAACQVELEFWDAAGKLVKSSSIANLAPGTAGSLNLKLAEVTTNTSPLRTEIRGVVRSNPISPTASGGSTTPPLLPVVYSQWCNVMTTLEVFDNSTGVTQAFTSDTRALQSGILPLARAVLDPQ